MPTLSALAVRLLARREHSRAELARKLAERCSDAAPEQIQAVLDDLQLRGLLDDHRAADSWLAAKASRYGERRLERMLREKGLEPELARNSLRALRESELERARALCHRRFGAPAPDSAARTRQARFLLQRGFDSDVIRRVLRETEHDPSA